MLNLRPSSLLSSFTEWNWTNPELSAQTVDEPGSRNSMNSFPLEYTQFCFFWFFDCFLRTCVSKSLSLFARMFKHVWIPAEEAHRWHKDDIDFSTFPLLTFHLSVSPADGGPQARCRSSASDFAADRKGGRSEVERFLLGWNTGASMSGPCRFSPQEFLEGALWRFLANKHLRRQVLKFSFVYNILTRLQSSSSSLPLLIRRSVSGCVTSTCWSLK